MEGPVMTDSLTAIIDRVLYNGISDDRLEVVQAVLDLIPDSERDERLREAIEMMLPSSERIAQTFQDAWLRAEPDPDDTGEVLGGDTVVHVRRQWNDVDGGRVMLRDLPGWQYTDQVGSTYNSRGRSPRPMLHAYALCTDIDGLEVSHTCRHGPPPHRIKVVIVAKDNSKQVMAHLRTLT